MRMFNKNTICFSLSHSVASRNITAKKVWRIWSDVNNWIKWDKGLSECKLTDEFKVGTRFSLTPQGAPQSLTTTLIEVVENKKFVDETAIPFGTVKVTHEITEGSEGITVTHTINADIYEEKVEAFKNTLLQKWEKGLPNSVKNVVELAEGVENLNTATPPQNNP